MSQNPKINVLFLIDQIGTGRGGSEQHLLWLLRKLPESDVTKNLVIFSNTQAASEDIFPVKPLILGNIYGKGTWSFFNRFFHLVRLIKERKIDIVHAFTIQDELVACLACVFARRGTACGHRRNIGYILTPKTKRLSRCVQWFKIPYIANSQAAINAAFELECIPQERFTAIYNPVFAERLQEGIARKIIRQEIGVPENAIIIGMVATVRPIKGYEILIQAAKIIITKYPNAYFLCVGEQQADYLEKMQKLASKLGVTDNFIWYGGLDNPYRITSQFTVAVLSSHSESFSNAVLEYSVAGLPIVATDVGGMKEIITDGVTGRLVPPNDPQMLADRILTLLENPEQRQHLGENAQKFANERFDEETIQKQYLDFYKKIYQNTGSQ